MTANELMQGGPRLCEHCEADMALVSQGSRWCERCREAYFGTTYKRDASEEEQRMNDAMEGSGASLEPSMHRWGGGRRSNYDGRSE